MVRDSMQSIQDDLVRLERIRLDVEGGYADDAIAEIKQWIQELNWSFYYRDDLLPKKPISRLQSLMNRIARFSDKTFGDGQRNPAILHHLWEEVDEAIRCFENGEREAVKDEYADMLILLLDSARKHGINSDKLIDLAFEKTEVNERRKWGTPDKNGVVRHIKDD